MKLFSGCTFYFYPPRSASRLNGIKASSSARYGACIAAQLDHTVTHVLVASGDDTNQFWKIVAGAQLGNSCVVLSSNWCSECIEQRRLVDEREFLLVEPANECEPPPLPESPAKRAKRENAVMKLHSSSSNGNGNGNAIGNENDVTANANGTGIGSNDSNDNANDDSGVWAALDAAAAHHRARRTVTLRPASGNTGADHKQLVVDMLRELMLARRAGGEDYSARAYEKAISEIEKYPARIVRGGNVSHLVSPRMVKLIDQICEGRLVPACVGRYNANSRQNVLDLFCTVFGVGPHHAKRLYDKGHRTLADLRAVLDENGRVSIDHHEELVERMSRTEVELHYQRVQQLASELDPDLELYCMGSYRRGKPDCGDIDIIVTKPGTDLHTLNGFLDRLVGRMLSTGFATHTFTRGSDRWLGATQVTKRWRRMDVLIVPSREIGAAILYYTGSGEFNRQMRWVAKQQNLRLNHNGLFKGTQLLESRSEEKIFEILGIPYRKPEER